MTRTLAALAVAALVLVAGSGPAFGDRPRSSRSLVALEIEAPAELSRYADRLASWEPQRLEAFAFMLGLAAEGSGSPIAIHVVLAPESGALARAAPSWVAGYARGDVSTVVLFPTRVPAYPYRSLEELLGHEVAHVMIFRASRGRPLPRWFHEGLSMLAEEAWGMEDRSRVALAVMLEGRSDLAGLDRLFSQPGEVHRAYALAGAFVRDLFNRHGRSFPAALLAGVASGEDFDAAFESATGERLAQAVESFWRRFTFWYRWFPFMTSSTALWLAITALALLAGRRRRQRARLLGEKWELEEAWELERRRQLEASPPPDDEVVN